MISFFAKHTYLLNDPDTGGAYLQRVSSRIFEQLAEYMGAKMNPDEGYENDVCIYIKPRRLDHIKDGAYVNMSDDINLIEMLKTRPGINVLAISEPQRDYLETVLPNKILYIPHYHVNFENFHRDRKEIVTCGYVGANNWKQKKINRGVGEALEKAGFKFIPLFTFETREDIINFYKSIDIQVIGYFGHQNVYKDFPHYHPTKIVNAMSFGIPTIAGPRLGYKEIEDFYIPANNMDELIREVKKLREDPEYYKSWSEKGLKKAEEYHISKTAKFYQDLT